MNTTVIIGAAIGIVLALAYDWLAWRDAVQAALEQGQEPPRYSVSVAARRAIAGIVIGCAAAHGIEVPGVIG